MQGNQHIIGITGGIGSGKSTVCKIFEILGAVTYYADDRAKWLMENDSALVAQIKQLFGSTAYVGGRLDRAAIASRVFNNEALLNELNAVVHPAVSRDVKKWVSEHPSEPLLLKEAALLFETGSYRELHKNILVIASEDLRIQRVLERDPQRKKEEVLAIMQRQMHDDDKIPLADYVISNDGSMSVIKQVMNIYQALIVA